MSRHLTAPLAPFVDALPVPRRLVAAEHEGRLTVRMRAGTHRFHRDLPESTIWGYDGTVPGPTIEAERGQPVTVEWRNELDGPLPVVVTVAPHAAGADGVPVQCVPGLSGGSADRNARRARRPHGRPPARRSDAASMTGGPRTSSRPDRRAVFHYPMDQRAALLWYHDHVMGVTKLDVYAGLAGLWIVRDDRERDLGAAGGTAVRGAAAHPGPQLRPRRAGAADRTARPQDRPGGHGGLPAVHGRERQGLAASSRSSRRPTACASLNGSNARTYRLVLLRDGAPELERITQIGTDHGLLRTPARVPADGLVLAPAERADLLVDFSDLAPGSELTVLNTAAAPFDGTRFHAMDAESVADVEGLLPYPRGAALPRRRRGGETPLDPARARDRLRAA